MVRKFQRKLNPIENFQTNYMEMLQQVEQLQSNGDLDEAEELCQTILSKESNNAIALHYSGLIAYQQQRYTRSIYLYQQAIQLCPHVALFHFNIALAYLKQEKSKIAIKHLNTAITHDPITIEPYIILCRVYLSLMEYFKAKEIIQQALQVNIQNSEVWECAGTVYDCQKDIKLAKEHYERALSLDAKNVTARANLGKIKIQLGDLKAGEADLLQTLEIESDNYNVFNNLANLYLLQGKPLEACRHYQCALEHNPKLLPALVNLGVTLQLIEKNSEAIEYFKEILTKGQNFEYTSVLPEQFFLDKAQAGLALAYRSLCWWNELDEIEEQALKAIRANLVSELPPIISPFQAVMWDLDIDLIKQITHHYNQEQKKKYNELKPTLHLKERHHNGFQRSKIKVAFFSPDLGDHPVGLLTHDLFALFDRKKYEIYAFSLKQRKDPYAKKIQQDVDHFYDISASSDEAVINLLRVQSIDILIDMSGHTLGARPVVLNAKVVPIQALWLGYMNTYGEAMDYVITHKEIITEHNRSHFYEKIVYLPDCLVAKEPMHVPQIDVPRRNLGLPEDCFIFCCFNRHYRIDKQTFQLWLSILKAVPDSVLWLNTGGKDIDEAMLKEANQHDISKDRFIFSPKEKLTKNWHHRFADLWLDTLTLGAGTASVLSISAGLPLITYAGHSPQSRVAIPALLAAGLGDCVAKSLPEYLEKSVYLARNPKAHQKLKAKVLASSLSSDLFNPSKFVKNFERAIDKMIDNERLGDLKKHTISI